MARRYRRKCRHCKRFFIPDPRNLKRQQYCSEPPCRGASKAASQRRWLSKPENRDVFKGPIHVARVQAWRRAHPGYWRRSPARGSLKGAPLQDNRTAGGKDHCEHNPVRRRYYTFSADWAKIASLLIARIASLNAFQWAIQRGPGGFGAGYPQALHSPFRLSRET